MAASSSGTRAASAYKPQLDGLRALGVTAVCYHHWVHESVLGRAGVQLFFVISGYLITGILLDAGNAVHDSRGRRHLLRAFYARRFLRIVPLFYATVLVAAYFDVWPIRESVWWHLGYLSNVYISLAQQWTGRVSHFWSLAVEEQFYFLWPWVLIFFPRRRLVPLLVLLILTAPLFRLGMRGIGVGYVSLVVLPVSSLDTLGIGALIAAIERQGRGFEEPGMRSRFALLASGALAAFVTVMALTPSEDAKARLLATTFLAVVFGWVVFKCARGASGPLGAALNLRPVRYLGRISYGVYVIHNFAQLVVDPVIRSLHLAQPVPTGVRALVLASFTLATASLSWHFFEQPINRLKVHFPYARRSDSSPVGAQPGASPALAASV